MVYAFDKKGYKYWLDNFLSDVATLEGRFTDTNAAGAQCMLVTIAETITAAYSAAYERLLYSWADFAAAVKAQAGNPGTGYIAFNGFVNFPANGNYSNLGLYHAKGVINGGTTNMNGSAEIRPFASGANKYICQYNNGDLFYVIFTGTRTQL